MSFGSQMFKEKGVTFLELVVTIAIIGILAAIAVPSYSDYVERQRLIGATEAVYSAMQLARRQAISNNRTIYFYASGLSNTTSNWCSTQSEASGGSLSFIGADCSGAFVTDLASNTSVIRRGQDYEGIHLFVSGGSASETVGFVMPGLSIDSAKTFVVRSDRLGDVDISIGSGFVVSVCSDDISQYPEC